MYKPLKVENGWLVFFIEEGKPPRPADGRTKPYTHKTHAYRRARKLNKDLEEIEKMIKRDGAIILSVVQSPSRVNRAGTRANRLRPPSGGERKR